VVAWPLQGLTGRLSLTPEGRIERQLQWARMRDGAVEPADLMIR
jgi:outer membrane PBP1 activator LpoA protein